MATLAKSERESGICDVCDACLQGTAEIFKDERPQYSPIKYEHHTSLETFGSAVLSSCPFCLGLWNRYFQRPVESTLGPNFKSDWSAMIRCAKPHHFHTEFRIFKGDKKPFCSLDMTFGRTTVHLVVFLYANPSSSPPIYTTATGAPEALQIVKGWLTTCQKDHARCSKSDVWYPTRLLHIVRHDKLRLVDTATYSVSGPYCTLSYCWGTPSKAPVLLTAESMSTFTSGIDVEDLPRTFRDAVKVCIELEVRYLWIDSLCIIQNDRTDWEREGRSMHKVYSHGLCNLSATASGDSDGGLFRTRPYDHDQRTKVDIHRPDNLISPGQYTMMERSHFYEQVEYTPLQTRAWAFQERVLSPRNIHFGPTGMVWECNTCIAFERGLSWKLEGRDSPFKPSPNRAAYERDLINEPSDAASSRLLSHWVDIQQNYSGRSLTYACDREIALAGVVDVLEREYNQVCTFGLWENYLLAGLVWQRHIDQGSFLASWPNDGSSNHSQPCAWIPSFSWLAADGAITSCSAMAGDYWCDMVHYDLRNVAGVPNFRPHVLLCGKLRQVTIKVSSEAVDVKLEGRYDSPFEFPVFDRKRQVFEILSKPENSHFCLPLANPMGILCVILQVKEQGSTTFRRIGSCTVYRENIKILKSRQKNEATFPCESYDPKTGKHVIRIE